MHPQADPKSPPADERPRRARWWLRVISRESTAHEDGPRRAGAWKEQMQACGFCVFFTMFGWFAPHPAIGFAAFLLAYISGAWFAAEEAWKKLRERAIDVHFLMLAVAAGAALIGDAKEGAVLLSLFSFSGALERYATARMQNEIRSLAKNVPATASVLDEEGAERVVPVDELTVGQRLRIRPGEPFPADAEVVRGETAANEAPLTGEAAPVGKTVGDAIFAGTMNLGGSVEAIVTRPARESVLQKIILLIQSAERSKAPAQRLTDRFGARYTCGILALAAVMFFVWWRPLHHRSLVSAPGDGSAFYRAMTLLVVASPCALVLSIPSAILAAIARGARDGILFRDGAAIERLTEVRVIAMDKSGTLTTGDVRVERVESFPPGREDEVLRLAFSLSRHSSHPLARAIVRQAKKRGVPAADVTDLAQTSGAGLRGICGGRELRLGRRSWARVANPGTDDPAPAREPLGITEVWLRASDLDGRLLLRDDIRLEARGLIEQLRAHKLRTLVLTSDRRSTADVLKSELGVDEVRADLHPGQKLAAIEEMTGQGEWVAMIGDGVNDAPSLAAAHVGVAMGARGSEAALERAAVVLMENRLEKFLAAYRLSRRARTIIRQNLSISLGVLGALVVLALLQKISLSAGVAGHEGSTLVVVLNSLRLLFEPKK